MKLELNRVFIGDDYTIGHLFIDGTSFCDTLEDIPRAIKIADKTCIPKGTYKVILNMSNRFKKIMPLLLEVHDFDGIRIHSGNSSKDTSGCILVGKNSVKGGLTDSRTAFDKLMTKLKTANDITIEIN